MFFRHFWHCQNAQFRIFQAKLGSNFFAKNLTFTRNDFTLKIANTQVIQE